MKHFFTLLLLSCLFSYPIFSQNPPKLGLTLSGGGAKGLAHIGVLKVLEEEGIEPQFISGTSMGSIVGGLYAIGYTADDMEKIARSVDWLDYFNDDVPRSFQPIEAKEVSERYQFSFPIKGGRIQLPKGFIMGAKMSMLLSRLTLPVHQTEDFDKFKIPFRCLATNLITGEAYVFSKGFLPDAMRASACIPTVFEPLEYLDYTLIDGMFVRNLPVNEVKDMGADLVIAVDVGAPLSTKEELTSFLGVLGQTTSFGMVQSTLEQQKIANVLVIPEVNEMGALDFANVDTLIARGEKAARAMLPQIRELKKKLNIPESFNKPPRPSLDLPETITITSVKFEGDKISDKKTLTRLLKIKAPEVITLDELTNKLMRMYASGFFTFVDYRLLPEGDGYQLIVRTRHSGDVYVRAGGFYDTNINAAILVNGTFRNFLFKGSNLAVDVRISETPGLFVDYLVHTNSRPNVGLRIDGKWNFFPGDYYENNSLADEFAMQHAKDQIGLYSGISSHSSIWLGWGTEIFVQKQVFSVDEFESVNLTQNYLFMDYTRDKLNRKYFPTKGYRINLHGKYVLNGKLRNRVEGVANESTAENVYAQFDYKHIFPLGKKSSLHWFNHAGYSDLRQSNYINLFYLGNSLSKQDNHIDFVGFDYMEKLVNSYAFSGLKYQWQPAVGYFFSATANYGYYQLDEFNLVQEGAVLTKSKEDGQMFGVGLELGMLVRQFGPLSLASEYNFDTEKFNTYLRIGYAF